MDASNLRKKRYDDKPKLNYKKLLAVVIAVAVIVMIVISIIKIIQNDTGVKEAFVPSYFTVYDNNKWGVINEKRRNCNRAYI